MTTVRVDVKPELLRWARERTGLDVDALAKRFPKLKDWEAKDAQPTLKQLEDYAKATHSAVGFFFLKQPPVERVPIPDYRTMGGHRLGRPSPDLLDTIYLCQQRQEWYHDFARSNGDEPLSFVGSSKLSDEVVRTAETIRSTLAIDVEQRRKCPTWEEALSHFCDRAEEAGVLVMRNGIVLNNTHRKLDPEEFRGFALSDELAPLVFINAADTKSAQMFTLAHELAHLWLGESAVSDASLTDVPDHVVEGWCNRIAAELLVPLRTIRDEYGGGADLTADLKRLAGRFKVSTLVVLRRILDLGAISRQEFWSAYEDELRRLKPLARSSGGDFYRVEVVRTGRRFAQAIVESALEGSTLYRDAFRLLGFSKFDTFQKLGQSLGVMS